MCIVPLREKLIGPYHLLFTFLIAPFWVETGTHEEVRNLEHFRSEEDLKRMLRKSGKLE